MRNMRMPVITSGLLCIMLSAIPGAASATQGIVTIKGVPLFVSDEGRGDAVLLLHGGFMDSSMWDADAAELRNQFRVIRLDLRGFGRSPRAASPYLPSDDIAAVLDHLGVSRAHVIGISMGGGVAIDFALAHPQRVRSLVLAEPGLDGWKWSSDVMNTMDTVMKVSRERGREAAIEEFLRRPVFASAKEKPQAYAQIRSQLLRNFSLESPGMKAPAKVAIDHLREISPPTLLLTAELGGPDAKGIAALLAKEMPRVTVVEVKGSGHMINLEEPWMFQQLIQAFLAGQKSEPAAFLLPARQDHEGVCPYSDNGALLQDVHLRDRERARDRNFKRPFPLRGGGEPACTEAGRANSAQFSTNQQAAERAQKGNQLPPQHVSLKRGNARFLAMRLLPPSLAVSRNQLHLLAQESHLRLLDRKALLEFRDAMADHPPA